MTTEFHIGIDDTDSEKGGCTTYTAARMYEELSNNGFEPTDYPWLVRLNPNIPWKTRGNGALSIHLLIDEKDVAVVREIAIRTVLDTTDTSASGADPAVVLLQGPIPQVLRDFSLRALHDVIAVPEARRIAGRVMADVHPIKGSRGIIGSLAAIGAGLDGTDHTFEIIAYRSPDYQGKPRRVDLDSVRRMDSEFAYRTFHNLDPETGRVLICPHGPDPVLLGIRGRDPDSVKAAFSRVRVLEPVERVMVFRTNQGTDAHIRCSRKIADLTAFQSVVLSGRVEAMPRILRGGHVVFRLGEGTGSVDCLAFEPTGSLMRIARELLPGDRLRVSGGTRHKGNGLLSVNLEKIEIVELADAFREENPNCPKCFGRCESMGRNQGFRCKKCGLRDRKLSRGRTPIRRGVASSVYIAVPRARRHLTRPDPCPFEVLNAIPLVAQTGF